MTPDPAALLQHAIAHHQAGRLREAEALYRTILQQAPHHPDAHHNLGQLARQVGQPRAALPHLQAAVNANPSVGQYWLSLIAALIDCGETTAARHVLDQGRARGLMGDAVEALAARLASEPISPPPPQPSAPPEGELTASEPPAAAAKVSTAGTASSDPEAPLAPAIALREAGDYAAARQWLEDWLAQQPRDIAAWALLAHVALLQKEEAQAETALQRAAALDAQHPAVLRNQARLLIKRQQAAPALALAQQACTREPSLENQLVLAAALAANGRETEAAPLIERILQAKPDYAEAWANRALLLLRAKQLETALEAAQKAVSLKPHLEQVWALIASLHAQQRAWGQAAEALRQSFRYAPTEVSRLSDLGEYLRRDKQLDEALRVLEQAVTAQPHSYAAWVNYGTALQEAERIDEARAAYEKALALQPNSAEVANNLGALAKDREDWQEALRYFSQALTAKPDHVEIMSNKAAALCALERYEEAETLARAALALDESYKEAMRVLAGLLKKKDLHNEALELLDRALQNRDKPLPNRFAYWLTVPSILASRQEIAEWRERYRRGIDELMAMEGTLDNPSEVAPGSFELAYHDADDRPIMEALSRLFRAKAPQLNYTAPHIAGWSMPQGRKIRIGFCSQFLVSHTIGKLYQGFLRGLDRQRFEVVLIYPPQAKRDPVRTTLEQSAERVIQLTGRLPNWQQRIAELQLDVLFYPDIGMSPSTYFLAHARLAPVQLVSYGHPDTTGIDTLDYFLGGDAPLEAEGAEAHYSEHLIRCARLPFCYQLFVVPTQIPTREALGLPASGALYGCPQSLFKLHPDFDAVLAAIAEGDPGGHIVLIDGHVTAWNERLKARWARTAPVLLERVHFVPRLPLDKFMTLMAHFDVVLDPIHFGSGNTLYEAMAYGKPIVTWPGRFARGRFVAAAYQQMGISTSAPIAASIEDYAQVAVAWGRDAERRAAFRQQALAAARENLYGDTRAVRALEAFLIAACEAAARGEKLPAGTRIGDDAASMGLTLAEQAR